VASAVWDLFEKRRCKNVVDFIKETAMSHKCDILSYGKMRYNIKVTIDLIL